MDVQEKSCARRKRTYTQILITVVIVLAVLIILYYCVKTLFIYYLSRRLAYIVHKMCEESTMQYRYELKFPDNLIPKFNYEFATALWDLGGIVGDGHCRESIPLPPPTDQHLVLYGKETTDLQGKEKRVSVGYIFWNSAQNWAAIIFSGTHYRSQWLNNMRTKQTPIDFIENEVSYKRTNKNQTNYKEDASSLIHLGFYNDYLSVREQIYEWFSKGVGSNIKKVIVSGRSLGGALSTVCAYDLSYKGDLNIVHYSFASPRVGNPVFVNRFNQQVPYSIRVYNNSDYVCDLPFSVFGNEIYSHVGTPETDFGFSINTGSVVKNHIDAYSDLRF